MAYRRTFFVAGLLLIFANQCLLAENPDDSLLSYAVSIHRFPMQTDGRYGIYLGRGLFITAAHVVGHGVFTNPKVAILGQEYPTRIVKEGSFEDVDLTLLAVDEDQLPLKLRMRRNQICNNPPSPGEQVITVTPEGTAYSYVLSPSSLPPTVRRFSTVIADVARTGNSGSGVFDRARKCLLGIMSRKISVITTHPATGKTETRDIAKYFVPALTIREFLPSGTAF